MSQPNSPEKAFTVDVIPMFSDNYAYLLRCSQTGRAALVDPASPEEVFGFLARKQDLQLQQIDAILTTHGHADHSAGNKPVLERLQKERRDSDLPAVQVFGGEADDIPALTCALKENQSFQIGKVSVKCIETPCHTPGSLCFFVEDEKEPVVFTGDTLFNFGCGNFNRGTGEQMHAALVKLAQLPSHTLVYSGHEYTLNNLRFAAAAEPHNKDVVEAQDRAKKLREEGLPTVPTTLAQEKLANPFLRWHSETVRQHVGADDSTKDSEVVRLVRRKKDEFGRGAGRL